MCYFSALALDLGLSHIGVLRVVPPEVTNNPLNAGLELFRWLYKELIFLIFLSMLLINN